MARRGVTQSMGDLFFTIAPDMSEFAPLLTAGIEKASAGALGNLGNIFENLGVGLMKKFTAPLAVATAANVTQFQALDREIRSVLTLFGTAPALLDETWGRMSAGITQVSEDVGGLERDIADGLYQAISAGVPEDDVFGFLDVAQMAAIADKTSDLTTAVDAITTVTNAFSAEALDAATASDILFAAVAQGKTTFGELGASIGRAAGSAANAGVKAAEFAASIATITQSGIQTSEAVSYLRASITGLLRPSEDMNAIFRQMGFASAEAAIPIIGLQPAFQAVVDAAGGSTSRLQELVGTAEGVSAILAITGENADAFAKSLDATEGSAGATARAFEIVDGGVGRSFGKLTEAFDRLGNYFGKLGSQIAQPLVDFLTDVVNRVAKIFRGLEPIFDAVIGAITSMFSVLDIPVVKQVTAAVASLAIAFGAILGVMGPVVFAFGKLFTAISYVAGITKVTKYLRSFGDTATSVAKRVGATYDKLAVQFQQKLPAATTTAQRAVGRLGTAMGKTAVKFTTLGLAAGAIAVAVAGAIYVWDRYQDKLESIRRQTQLTAEGVDRMAESLGVTLTALDDIDFGELEDVQISVNFILDNQDALRQFRSIYERFGIEGLEPIVIDFLFDLQKRGAGTDTINQAINEIESALELDLDIGFGDLIDQADIDGIVAKSSQVRVAIEEMFPSADLSERTDTLTKRMEGDLKEIAVSLADVYDERGYDEFVVGLRAAEAELGGVAAASAYLGDEVVLAFEAMNAEGDKFGFDTRSIYTLDDALGQLETKIDGFTTATGRAKGEVEELGRSGGLIDVGPATRTPVSKERLAAQKEAADAVAQAFITAEQHIASAFDAVYQGIVSSMPLLDIYSGAVTQSFSEWRKGQDQFQEDIVKVAEFRDQLKDLAPEVVAAFDASSLDKQAWLANLGADEQATAIEEMAESYGAVTDAVDTTWKQDVPQVVAEAKGIIQSEYNAMYQQALEAGAQTGFDYSQAFSEAASAWPGIAAHWLGQTAAVLSGGGTGGVTLGGPVIDANFTVTNTTVEVTSTGSENPARDVSRGLQTAGVQP